MRKELSTKNIITSIVLNIFTILLGFIAQSIFIKTLGIEYSGINGLFMNLVSVLALVELGIGPAIIYSLYKPIAYNEIEKIKSLLNLYKKSYNIISIIILILGIMILPFLKTIVNFQTKESIYIIFILFIFDAMISYLFTYKRSLIQANQKNYIINIIHSIYVVILNLLQIVILINTNNYILYLMLKIICKFIENIILSTIADKLYPFIKQKNIHKLEQEEFNSIKTRVKGIIFHKLGSVIVLGTDSLIISLTRNLGIAYVGIYSNYNLIISSVSNLLGQVFVSLTASIGNLLVKESIEYSYDLFKKIMFFNFWIYGLAGTLIFNLIKPFIILWIGNEYLLSNSIVVVLIINFFLLGMRASIGAYKDASGIYWEDRFVPIIELIVNVIISIVLVNKIGLIGIFIAKFLSSIIVNFISLPYFVYKGIFKRNIYEYNMILVKYTIVFIISIIFSNYLCKLYILNNLYITILLNFIITCLIVNLIYWIIYRKSEEYNYFKSLVLKILKKLKLVKN